MRWCLLCLLLVGCNKQDVEKLTSIGKKVGERVDALTPSDPALTQTWDNLTGRDSPPSRVRQRLQTDQPLEGCTIIVESDEPGQIRLKGEVKEARQRLRAVELARDTIGVKSVIDELK